MKNHYLTNIALILIATTILTGIGLSSSTSSAASASTTTAAVKVAAACTMSYSGGGTYSATVPNGTTSEIEGSTFSVTCNDTGGFALYAVGYSNDSFGNTNMIGPNVNIATNTTGTDSYWAMKINPTTGNIPTIENSFNNYHVVPDHYTKVASYSDATGSGSLSVTATYKVSISTTQLAGDYLGTVQYALVKPSSAEPFIPHEIECEAGKICYNPNSGDVIGEMGKQTTRDIDGANTGGAITNGSTAILWAPNFKHEGYGFAGWNTEYDYSGTNYGPNETITAPADIETNGLSLYAVWVPSAGTLQNWNGCSSMNIGDVTALTDNRDNETYAIAKLPDGDYGRCWTIENLRLDDTPELTSANTHNPSLPLTNSWYYNGGIQTTPTTSNHLSSPNIPGPWCNDGTDNCVNQSMLFVDNTTLFDNNTASNYNIGRNVYSYGNYYNWYSATAGNGTQNTVGFSGGDICPSGWFLPGELDFRNLHNAIDGEETPKMWRAYPNNFVLSADEDSRGEYRGWRGFYWSSYADDTYHHYAYFLWLEINNVNPDATWGGSKEYGRAIRCISSTY